jgi:hypothetical protein
MCNNIPKTEDGDKRRNHENLSSLAHAKGSMLLHLRVFLQENLRSLVFLLRKRRSVQQETLERKSATRKAALLSTSIAP